MGDGVDCVGLGYVEGDGFSVHVKGDEEFEWFYGCGYFWQVLLHVWTHRETSAGHGGRRQIGGGCGGALVPSKCVLLSLQTIF